MHRFTVPFSYCSVSYLTLALTFTFVPGLNQSAIADPSERTLVRVEEDWVALVAEPEAATSSPQILNFISPLQSASGVFGLVQVNHRDHPSFQPGGFEVQGFIGSTPISSSQDTKNTVLHRMSDRVRYTVAMEKLSSGIRFELRNGRSRTWGRFALEPVVAIVPVPNPSLEEYSPEFSVENTNVNVGAHRVDLLYLDRTRRTYSDGETTIDETNRVIHRYQLHVEDISLEEYEQNPDDYNIGITE